MEDAPRIRILDLAGSQLRPISFAHPELPKSAL
jgi:hypothetical protein